MLHPVAVAAVALVVAGLVAVLVTGRVGREAVGRAGGGAHRLFCGAGQIFFLLYRHIIFISHSKDFTSLFFGCKI